MVLPAGRTRCPVDRRTLAMPATPPMVLTAGGGAFALWKPKVILSAARRGDQNYPVRAGVRVPTDVTVLIWGRAFAVPVANATLA